MVIFGLLMTGKRHNEGFWYAGNNLFLDVAVGCTGMYITEYFEFSLRFIDDFVMLK